MAITKDTPRDVLRFFIYIYSCNEPGSNEKVGPTPICRVAKGIDLKKRFGTKVNRLTAACIGEGLFSYFAVSTSDKRPEDLSAKMSEDSDYALDEGSRWQFYFGRNPVLIAAKAKLLLEEGEEGNTQAKGTRKAGCQTKTKKAGLYNPANMEIIFSDNQNATVTHPAGTCEIKEKDLGDESYMIRFAQLAEHHQGGGLRFPGSGKHGAWRMTNVRLNDKLKKLLLLSGDAVINPSGKETPSSLTFHAVIPPSEYKE